LIYERKYGTESFLIVINPAGKKVTVSVVYDKTVKKVTPVLGILKGENVLYKKGELKVIASPVSYGVYKID